jgi:hypothetical protein
MGLQIRVRHPLGERVIELPDRTIDEPLVVGRAATAEIQVPSVTVAPKHCVLFIHEGHWAVQDLGAGAGTFVNHEPVSGARFLQIGDTISVGGDGNAPTIEIDPAAAAEGRTGFAGTGPAVQAAVMPTYGAYAVPAAPMAPMSQPAYGYAQPAHAPQYAAAQAQPAHEAAGGDTISFDPSATVGYSSSRRRAKKSSAGPMIAIFAVVIGIGGAAIGYAVYASHRNDKILAENEAAVKKAAAEKAAAEKAREEAHKPVVVFQGLGDDPIQPKHPKPPAPRPAAVAPSTPSVTPSNPSTPAVTPSSPVTPASTPKTPGTEEGMDPIKKPAKPSTPGAEEGMDPIKKPTKPATPGAEEGMDPIKKPAKPGGEEGMDPIKKPATPPKKDPENLDPAAAASWDAMKDLAEQGGKESFAVLRFEDFKRLNPGQHDTEIDAFIDKKMDRIWWERVALLLKKLDRYDTDMVKIKEEIVDENNPEEKKKKLDAYKKMDEDKKLSVKTLRDVMKYEGKDVPNLDDSSSLANLASQRNKAAYENWKRITIVYIKSNQGRLPWSNDF